jgi:transcriptional regulator with XRE-family HTH domain
MQGNKVRFYREERGLTTRQLAEAVGCDQSLIVRIEHGERTASDDLKTGLAQFFTVPITDIFFQPVDDQQSAEAAAR